MTDNKKVVALDLGEQADLDSEMTAYFAKCQEKLGFIPNVLAAYAFDASKLKNFVAFHDELMLGPSGLSKLEREMIAVVVSSANHCYYCLTAHGAVVRRLSKDPLLGEQLVMNYRVADLSPKQRAMLDFAWKLTKTPEGIDEPDRAVLRTAGFHDRDIWDIASVVGFFNMTNRLASTSDMRPNLQYATMARE